MWLAEGAPGIRSYHRAICSKISWPIQREIYLAFADRIGTFAETVDWTLLAAYLPMGFLFGAVHALTPGHSKAVLATYLTGSTATVPRAFLVSFVLSATHVTMSVVIALLSLPLVPSRRAASAARRCWRKSAADCSAFSGCRCCCRAFAGPGTSMRTRACSSASWPG